MVENGNTRRNYPALESMTCCVLFLLAQVEPETVDRWPEAPYTSFDEGDLWRKYLEVCHEDVTRPTQSGTLPLHYAIRLGCNKPIIADGPSVVCNLVEKCPEAASQTDKSGRTALHLIAELVKVWDEGAEAILNAHPPAARLRAGPELHNRLAIHIAAARPDADRSLIEHLVQVHPRGVALADGLGRLPLHLACEAAKTWDKGVRAIYDAFPDAIRQAEENERSWMPLTMAAACPNAGADLIDVLAELHPEADSQVDNDGRLALHWACVSGKPWEDGLKAIFDANPDASIAADSNGHLPFHLAALAVCTTGAAEENTGQEPQQVERPRKRSRVARMSFRSPSIIEPEHDEVEILFQLLRAEPSVLHTH